LSYHRAREAGPEGGSSTMTVCTNDVARGDLVEDRLPVAVADAFGDVEALVSEVVELEHEWIRLAAVHARSLAEEVDEVGGTLRDDRSLVAEGVRYVALAMLRVMLAFVLRSASPAVVVALPARLPAPGEVR
jgi:hypothetical protein